MHSRSHHLPGCHLLRQALRVSHSRASAVHPSISHRTPALCIPAHGALQRPCVSCAVLCLGASAHISRQSAFLFPSLSKCLCLSHPSPAVTHLDAEFSHLTYYAQSLSLLLLGSLHFIRTHPTFNCREGCPGQLLCFCIFSI